MDYKAGMFVYAFAFLLGVLFVQQLAMLPEFTHWQLSIFSACALITVFGLFYRKKKPVSLSQVTLVMSLIILILLGICYSISYAKSQLILRLDDGLVGQDILLRGVVADIPVPGNEVVRFEFYVDSYQLATDNDFRNDGDFPEKIRLSWYYGQQVNAGEEWQLKVRLKPPHGFMNPGGFDYEKWLFQHGIHATGYVRKSGLNVLRDHEPFSINRLRQFIAGQIDGRVSAEQDAINTYSLLKALAVGDKSSITGQQWRVLTNTGTGHLMAISGLHIGLAALFAYALFRRILPSQLMKRVPAQHVALIAGMVMGFIYALIAGFTVPTQRAVIMLLVLSMMLLLRRNHRPVDALGFALMCVLLLDPLAVLSAGFWFSFSAVAVIFISFSSAPVQSDQQQAKLQDEVVPFSIVDRLLLILRRWVRLQLLISILLLPLSLFMFQQASLVSPVANLLLIPYVSFLVVPLVLLAMISLVFSPSVSHLLFDVAAWLLDLVWPYLNYLSNLPFSHWVRGDVGILDLLSATSALLLWFYSGRLGLAFASEASCYVRRYATWSTRMFASLLLIPLFMTSGEGLRHGEYQLTVLDVGQGSAAVIRTQGHVLVFDSGAKFSDRLNAGSGVVVPYLLSQGIDDLDLLVISHGDADHIGGASAIIEKYPGVDVLGQDIQKLQTENKQACSAGKAWQWDGVDFVFLSPDSVASASADMAQVLTKKRNDGSCVLRVASASGSVLFTGDIEKKTENKLLETYGGALKSDILMVPHHGSNTSSGAAFIDAVDAGISIISVGYKNRYRLPSTKVIRRLDAGGGKLLQTDWTGAITIRLTQESVSSIDEYRQRAGRYWHHQPVPSL